MSFILDALRKSEHERQRQAGPDIAPQGAVRKPGFSWTSPWMLAIVVLLVVNAAAITLLFTRIGQPQPYPTPAEAQAAVQDNSGAQQYSIPTTTTPPPTTETPTQFSATPTPPPVIPAPEPSREAETYPVSNSNPAPPRSAVQPPPADVSLPTIHQLDLGTLPDLHLDLHVYAANPQERFVSINGRKYREGDQTPEGIGIDRITPRGVVLNQRGRQFLLPR